MIDYIEQGHLYLNSMGIIIPSVSSLVQYATGEDYSFIPSSVLHSAQEFGTNIHDAIEQYLKQGIKKNLTSVKEKLAFDEFLRVYQEYIKEDFLSEELIDFNERYAGRIDCYSNGVLIDFKTNHKLNIPHLEWQLSYYAMALEQKGIKVDKLMCLWLPKGKSAKWVKVERILNKLLIENLTEYERSHQ